MRSHGDSESGDWLRLRMSLWKRIDWCTGMLLGKYSICFDSCSHFSLWLHFVGHCRWERSVVRWIKVSSCDVEVVEHGELRSKKLSQIFTAFKTYSVTTPTGMPNTCLLPHLYLLLTVNVTLLSTYTCGILPVVNLGVFEHLHKLQIAQSTFRTIIYLGSTSSWASMSYPNLHLHLLHTDHLLGSDSLHRMRMYTNNQ